MKGININCKYQNFVEQILNGEKTLETRECNSLNRFIGKRVGIVKTGCGKAMLMGFMDITGVIVAEDEATFREYESRHLVHKGSDFDFKKKKYMYIIENVERCKPRIVTSKGYVARDIFIKEEN